MTKRRTPATSAAGRGTKASARRAGDGAAPDAGSRRTRRAAPAIATPKAPEPMPGADPAMREAAATARTDATPATASRDAARAKRANGATDAATPPKPDGATPAASADTRPRTAPTRRVRQSCRLTVAEYAALTTLKKRASALARPTKRGGLLRAGVYALRDMSDAQLFALLDGLPDPEAAPA